MSIDQVTTLIGTCDQLSENWPFLQNSTLPWVQTHLPHKNIMHVLIGSDKAQT